MEKKIIIDGVITKMIKKVKPQWWTALIGGMLCGLVAYTYIITNNFLTYDSTWNIYSDQDMITSGRQFLTYACGISSFYNLPWLNGILAILYLSLSAVVVVEGLGIESKVGAALSGGLLVTFPAIASTFCYIFTIDGYMLAVLLASLAFLFADRKKWGFLGGILLLGVSIGIYQAYLSFTIILCILRLLLDVLEKEDLKEIWAKIWRYIVMGIGAYIFYVVTLKIMLYAKGVELSGYQGTDRVTGVILTDIPAGLVEALKSFGRFFMPGNVLRSNKLLFIAFCLVLLLAAVMYVIHFCKEKRYKSILRIALTLGLAVAIPFGANIVNILSPYTYFHLLLRLPWALFLIFALVLIEIDCKTKKTALEKIWKSGCGLVLICAVLLIGRFCIMANIVGFNMNERYEKTYATCVRIVDRIEQTPGYKTGTKVAILGGFPNHEFYYPTDITIEDLAGFFGADGSVFVSSSEGYAKVFKHYLNFTVNYIPAEEEYPLVFTEEFAAMPRFPAEGSIAFIGDVLVVKING